MAALPSGSILYGSASPAQPLNHLLHPASDIPGTKVDGWEQLDRANEDMAQAAFHRELATHWQHPAVLSRCFTSAASFAERAAIGFVKHYNLSGDARSRGLAHEMMAHATRDYAQAWVYSLHAGPQYATETVSTEGKSLYERFCEATSHLNAYFGYAYQHFPAASSMEVCRNTATILYDAWKFVENQSHVYCQPFGNQINEGHMQFYRAILLAYMLHAKYFLLAQRYGYRFPEDAANRSEELDVTSSLEQAEQQYALLEQYESQRAAQSLLLMQHGNF